MSSDRGAWWLLQHFRVHGGHGRRRRRSEHRREVTHGHGGRRRRATRGGKRWPLSICSAAPADSSRSIEPWPPRRSPSHVSPVERGTTECRRNRRSSRRRTEASLTSRTMALLDALTAGSDWGECGGTVERGAGGRPRRGARTTAVEVAESGVRRAERVDMHLADDTVLQAISRDVLDRGRGRARYAERRSPTPDRCDDPTGREGPSNARGHPRRAQTLATPALTKMRDASEIRAELTEHLQNCRDTARQDVAEARRLLRAVLVGRFVFVGGPAAITG